MIREFTISEFWYLLQTTRWTILLAAVAFVGGGVVGFIVALLRIAKSRALKGAAIPYIRFFQGTRC